MVFLEATKGNLMGALNDDCLLDWLILEIWLTRQKCKTKAIITGRRLLEAIVHGLLVKL